VELFDHLVGAREQRQRNGNAEHFAVFMLRTSSTDGRPLIERVADLLPEAKEDKVAALPGR
jgi:hypothetical protein